MKKLFKKAQETSAVKTALEELYCTFDSTTALIKLRKLIALAKQRAPEDVDELIEGLVMEDAATEHIIYSIPCLCEVRYKFRPITSTAHWPIRPITYTRYYTAYGVNDADIDAYLDMAIQLDISTFEETLSGKYHIDYTIEEITPCIK